MVTPKGSASPAHMVGTAKPPVRCDFMLLLRGCNKVRVFVLLFLKGCRKLQGILTGLVAVVIESWRLSSLGFRATRTSSVYAMRFVQEGGKAWLRFRCSVQALISAVLDSGWWSIQPLHLQKSQDLGVSRNLQLVNLNLTLSNEPPLEDLESQNRPNACFWGLGFSV